MIAVTISSLMISRLMTLPLSRLLQQMQMMDQMTMPGQMMISRLTNLTPMSLRQARMPMRYRAQRLPTMIMMMNSRQRLTISKRRMPHWIMRFRQQRLMSRSL